MHDLAVPYRGLRWPAEFSPHDATWVSWPRNAETWPNNLALSQSEHATFVRTIADFEKVHVLAGGDARETAERALGDHPNIELVDIPTNDAWARDHAPTFVLDEDQRLVAINWIFNAWGGKYPPFDNDQAAGSLIAKHLGCGLVRSDKVFEGGAIETNGEGLLLTTRSCALDPIRNPGITAEEFESIFRSLLGVDRIAWLPGDPIIGDDTDGHIDQIARFVDRHRVLVAVQQETDDPNHAPLQGNWNELHAWNEREQAGLELIELPMPGPVELFGVRLPASYANFYIANSLVLVPQFDDPRDDYALGLLKDLFPKRQVIGSPARNLVVGLGSIHCMTQQQPAQF
ncbi:MAG: agmatine deiminase family protein [Planctomycetales bacterium]|nr:agmatine deiminase family protein [Planctomycetales bacterium]